MHRTQLNLVCLALIAAGGVANAQAPATPAQPGDAAPAARPPRQTLGAAIPIPDADVMYVGRGTEDIYTVAPYKLVGIPRTTIRDVIEVELYSPRGDEPAVTELPDSFIITANENLAATTLVLSMVKDGERVERRIEVLVVDQTSAAQQSYIEAQIRQTFPTSTVKVQIASESTVILRGYVEKPEEIGPILQLVESLVQGRTGDAQVINAIRVPGAQQVQLKVVIAEVARSKVRNLGFDWRWLDLQIAGPISEIWSTTGDFSGLMDIQFSPNSFEFTEQLPSTNGGNFAFHSIHLNQYAFFGFLRAIVNNNLGKILSEPVLTTMSGQPAFFNVGGEVPLLIPQGNQTISVEYRPFGTNIRFVPTVLGEGKIRLEVRPEISAVDASLSVTVAGGSVAGFNSRTVETTVELENGQTYVIAGLLQTVNRAVTNKYPFFGDLPLIGWAFQNKFYRQEETELLIIVTPHLVDALDEGICKLPGRESRVPNDVEFYIGSKFEPPCFQDPYRNAWERHRRREPAPVPVPVPPYDNYGRPPMQFVPAEVMPVAPAPVNSTQAAEADSDWQPSDGLVPASESTAEPAPPAAYQDFFAPELPPAVDAQPESTIAPETTEASAVPESALVPSPPAAAKPRKIVSVQAGRADANGKGKIFWKRNNRPTAGEPRAEGWNKPEAAPQPAAEPQAADQSIPEAAPVTVE